MCEPSVLVTEGNYHITLFRNGIKEDLSFFGATFIVSRVFDNFPIKGEMNDGYLYFIQAFYPDGTCTEIHVDRDEAYVIVNRILDQTCEDVSNY